MCLKLILFGSLLWAFFQSLSAARNGRIIAGTIADSKDFPWLVSVRRFLIHWCGGSIVNKRFILTAAHCIIDANTVELTVRVGSKYKSHGGDVMMVQAGAYHSNYHNLTQDYDIAALRLCWDISFSSKIQPIALPIEGAHLTPGTAATIAGWGKSEQGVVHYLRYAEVKIIPHEACRAVYPGFVYTERMFCAGRFDSEADFCAGDSGGPLVVSMIAVGIASFQRTDACGPPNHLGTYTRVSELVPWLKDYIRREN